MVPRPPVAPMLAQACDSLPPSSTLPGRLAFQPKWDGFRAPH